jgi:hypothetical protein
MVLVAGNTTQRRSKRKLKVSFSCRDSGGGGRNNTGLFGVRLAEQRGRNRFDLDDGKCKLAVG